MSSIATIVSDIIVIVFDLLIYTKLTRFKRDTAGTHLLAYCGCAVILAVYFISAYICNVPASIASLLCMSLPSFLLFWLLSEYKDARFFVTFCFVDTISLIVAFFSRAAGLWIGAAGSVVSCVLIFIMFLLIYIKARPYFSRYRELLRSVERGWVPVMLSTLLIYVLLIFAAAYPKPMMERTEYFPVYAMISLTVASFYVVFIMTLWQKKNLYELNVQLQNEQHWHNIAYVDALTEMNNRMAYIERINELERTANSDSAVHALMIDIDKFKQINDTLGHHAGDITLKKAASILKDVFNDSGYELFRIGGDEFAIIAIGVTDDALAEKINRLSRMDSHPDFFCTFSIGCSAVNFSENSAVENAFIRADRAMYEHKSAK